jgi:RimJ/RimL family protein N-acetyltransferase
VTVELRPVRPDDEQRLLAWRNDPEAVAQSLTSRPVTPQEHHVWFAGRLADPQRGFWIGEGPGGAVGHVRIDADGEVSVVVAAESRGQGHGSAMIAAASAAAGPPLHAVVRAGNAASLRAFLRNGFAEAGRSDDVVRLAL